MSVLESVLVIRYNNTKSYEQAIEYVGSGKQGRRYSDDKRSRVAGEYRETENMNEQQQQQQ